MLRKTILAALFLLGVATGHSETATNPTELPAIVVTGYVEGDYGYQFNQLIWTIPYNSYGSQNMKGVQYQTSAVTYGRMINRPALLHGPYHNLGTARVWHSTMPVRIDTDGDPREAGYDLKWQANTSYPGLNAAVTPFVAYTTQDVAEGVQPGDWAQISNPDTGEWIWALAGDYCDGHPEGEISEAAAWLMGWPFYQNSDTMFVFFVNVRIWPHTRGL